MPGIFNGICAFGVEISKPVPFLRFGRYLVRLKHRDQTPTCRKCNRPGAVFHESILRHNSLLR